MLPSARWWAFSASRQNSSGLASPYMRVMRVREAAYSLTLPKTTAGQSAGISMDTACVDRRPGRGSGDSLRQDHDVMSGQYTISFDERYGELRAQVKGESSVENTLAYWSEIADKVAQRRPRSLLLIDELAGAPLTSDEWMALVKAMEGKGFEALRIAHVKPNGLDRIEFCEIFAKEAGLDARVFSD